MSDPYTFVAGVDDFPVRLKVGYFTVPIYEYGCQACGHAFEQLVRSMDESHKAPCPECGSRKVERQMSVFAARQSGDIPACQRDFGAPPCAQCPGQGDRCPY